VQNLEAVAWKGDELFQGQIEDFHNFQGHGRDSLLIYPVIFQMSSNFRNCSNTNKFKKNINSIS
jgi:hypothetical protein